MKKWCLAAALALCALLGLAPTAGYSSNQPNSSEDQNTTLFINAGFAATRDSLTAHPLDPNAQTAYTLAFYAQFYASMAASNNDRSAASAASTFSLLAGQYSFNVFLTTGDATALNGYVFLFLGFQSASADAQQD
jgi:hypothetical protein